MISLNGNYGNIKGSYIPILYPNRRLRFMFKIQKYSILFKHHFGSEDWSMEISNTGLPSPLGGLILVVNLLHFYQQS